MITVRIDGVKESHDDPATLLAGVHGRLVWVDAESPDDAELEWLRQAFDLHPLEVDDIRERNERPKVDDYGGHLFVVLISALRDEKDGNLLLRELHLVVAESSILTVRDGPLPAIDALTTRCETRPELASGSAGVLFYRLCDAAIDSYFPLLDALEEDIDRLESSIVGTADRGTVADIFSLKRDLSVLRRILGPQRDLMQALAGPHGPQLDDTVKVYLRDVYDHAVRITEQIDAHRDIITGALDVYLSTVNNRLTEQTRRLAMVATIFLPLTFLTGFFGMNSAILVNFIAHDWFFWVTLGIMAASVPGGYWLSQRLSAGAQAVTDTSRRRGLAVTARPWFRHKHRDVDMAPSPAPIVTQRSAPPAPRD